MYPAATALFHRSRQCPYPDAVIRQMYPPRVIDSPGGITCEYFGWEESRLPAGDGRRLQPLPRRCRCHVEVRARRATRLRSGRSGACCGDRSGAPRSQRCRSAHPSSDRLRSFRFLHISSAFPRKGVDVLLDAYFSTFDGSSDVTLILKTFPNPHNDVGPLLERIEAHHPNPPDVRWIDRDLADAEVKALYNLSHCYVHPAQRRRIRPPGRRGHGRSCPGHQPGVLRARGLRVGADGGDASISPRTSPRPISRFPTRSGRSPIETGWRSRCDRSVDDPTTPRCGKGPAGARSRHDESSRGRRCTTVGRLHRRHGRRRGERLEWRW